MTLSRWDGLAYITSICSKFFVQKTLLHNIYVYCVYMYNFKLYPTPRKFMIKELIADRLKHNEPTLHHLSYTGFADTMEDWLLNLHTTTIL